MEAPKPHHVLFAIALSLIIAGLGLLLVTTKNADAVQDLWPLVFIGGGLVVGYVALIRSGKARALFVGLFVACVAAIKLGMNVLSLGISSYWPLFVVGVGLCLVPSGYYRYRRPKPGFMVPAVSFILLGLFFSIFSFGFSALSFRAFLVRWWPLLFIAGGLSLFVLWVLTRAKEKGDAKASP